MSSTTDQDKDYEHLNEAIMKALASSDDVKKALLNFQENNLIDERTALNLILSLAEIGSLMNAEELPQTR